MVVSRVRWARYTLTVAALWCGLRSVGEAQTPLPPILRGVVLDTLRQPLPLAEIILFGGGDNARHVARADPQGRFSFTGLGSGDYTVTVRRIGYQPIRVTLTLNMRKPYSVEFLMVPIAQRLSDVLVEAERGARARKGGPLLTGEVVDEFQQPVPNAEILISGFRPRNRGPFQVQADAEGRFRFPDLRAGRYAVKVRRIGYVPIQASLALEKATPRSVRFVMASHPFGLPEIGVVARRNDIARGVRRAAAYDGRFLTRDDILKAAPVTFGDFLSPYLPNVDSYDFSIPNLAIGLLPPLGGTVARSTFSSGRRSRSAMQKRMDFLGPPCAPVISVNGEPALIGVAINNFDPQQIEAVEVYRRRDPRHPVPWEFQEDLVFQRSCGSLVVIWLKRR